MIYFYCSTNDQALAAFVAALESNGVSATPRVRRGIDIDAGCGQLSTRRKKHDEKELRRAQQLEQASEAEAEASAAVRQQAAEEMMRGAPPSEAGVAGGW